MKQNKKQNKTNKFGCFLAMMIVAAMLIAAVALSYGRIEKFIYKTDYSEYVEKYSAEYNVDISLIYAVIKCESSFNSQAVSSVGAIGLMQLTPDTFTWVTQKVGAGNIYSTDDLYNAETNIRFGSYLLSLHLQEFGNERAALAAYHAGRGSVNKWLADKQYSADGVTLDSIPYGDTSSYVDRVINTKQKYNNIYNFNKESD